MFERMKAALGFGGGEAVATPGASLSLGSVPAGSFSGPITSAHIPGLWGEQADLTHTASSVVNARAVAQLFESADIRGATRLATSAIVGNGLRLNSAPLTGLIGWTDAQAAAYARRVEQLWQLWANSTEADVNGMLTFNEIMQLACLSLFSHGEIVFTIPAGKKRPGDMFGTKVTLLPPERLVENAIDHDTKRGIRFANGTPSGLVISDRDPVTDITDWNQKYVPFRSRSGRPLAGLIIDPTAAGQLRGVSILLGAIKPIFKAAKLSDAVLSAAQLQTLLALTITSSATSEEIAQLFSHGDSDAALLDQYVSAKLAWQRASGGLSGLPSVAHLLPGEELKMTSAQQDAGNLDEFAALLKREAAVAIGIPYSTLTSDYRNETYSSTRMSGAISHRLTLQRRATVAKFAQTVFSAWLEEAILNGLIDVPGGYMGFLPLRRAYEASTWNGPAAASADPLKDAKAMESRLSSGITSLQWEAEQATGQDWQTIADQRAAESAYYVGKGLPDPHGGDGAQRPVTGQGGDAPQVTLASGKAMDFTAAVERLEQLEANTPQRVRDNDDDSAQTRQIRDEGHRASMQKWAAERADLEAAIAAAQE